MYQQSPTSQESEQVKPLAWASPEYEQPLPVESKDRLKRIQRQKCMIQCCGCVTALILIMVVVLLVLLFTVFHVKAPTIQMTAKIVQKKSGPNNLTIVGDISVKNNNYASFKFENCTTSVYYRGANIGEGVTPSGEAKKRRTLNMNVTVEVATDKLLGNELLNFKSYTRMSGKIKILKTYRKNIVMNCTMIVNVTSQVIRGLDCRRHVSI